MTAAQSITRNARDLAMSLDVSEPEGKRSGAHWRRVALDLHTNERELIERMRRQLGVTTTRETIRRAIAYLEHDLNESERADGLTD